MKREIEIINYDSKKGIQINWEYGFMIEAKVENNLMLIRANEEGLISLAKQLLTLAQKEVPNGCHIHLDEYNSLETGSVDLVLEKHGTGIRIGEE